ncbi:MAG: acyl carrier protein [Puniceicoccaceae bacterium]
MSDPVLGAVNEVRANLGLPECAELPDDLSLRSDLGFDSLALAELTVRLEEATGVDVFAEGVVARVGEVRERIRAGGGG